MDGGSADPDPGEHGLEEVDGALRLGEHEGLVARAAHVLLVQEVDELVKLKYERLGLGMWTRSINDIV